MKKIIASLLTITTVLGFTACGEEETGGTVTYNSTSATEQTEETAAQTEQAESSEHSTGKMTITVPAGWKVFPVYDRFNDGAEKDTAVKIAKGAQTEDELNYTPYIQMDFYGRDSEYQEPVIEAYGGGEGVDIEPINTGKYTWKGFEVMIDTDLKLVVLYTEDELGNHYVASIWPELIGGKFSIYDSDVAEILDSVKPSN